MGLPLDLRILEDGDGEIRRGLRLMIEPQIWSYSLQGSQCLRRRAAQSKEEMNQESKKAGR